MTISAILLGLSQFIFVANFFICLFYGKVADRNPWHSNSLEWSAPSPPPHGNFEEVPIVHRGPYEYGHPDAEQDYVMQTDATGPKVLAAH
jgi:cytochrome c oxidase subunit 1